MTLTLLAVVGVVALSGGLAAGIAVVAVVAAAGLVVIGVVNAVARVRLLRDTLNDLD